MRIKSYTTVIDNFEITYFGSTSIISAHKERVELLTKWKLFDKAMEV